MQINYGPSTHTYNIYKMAQFLKMGIKTKNFMEFLIEHDFENVKFQDDGIYFERPKKDSVYYFIHNYTNCNEVFKNPVFIALQNTVHITDGDSVRTDANLQKHEMCLYSPWSSENGHIVPFDQMPAVYCKITQKWVSV